MEMIVTYMAGFIVTVGAFAVRAKEVEARALFIIALAWPLSILFAMFIFLLSTVGADFDVKDSNVRFGFRKATNPKARGFAVTLFGAEFQLYQMRKA